MPSIFSFSLIPPSVKCIMELSERLDLQMLLEYFCFLLLGNKLKREPSRQPTTLSDANLEPQLPWLCSWHHFSISLFYTSLVHNNLCLSVAVASFFHSLSRYALCPSLDPDSNAQSYVGVARRKQQSNEFTACHMCQLAGLSLVGMVWLCRTV